jgi:Fe-S-cluster containining protein
MEFPINCKGCGKCCDMIQYRNKPLILSRPDKIRVKFIYGKCEHLNDKNECNIYDQERPSICENTEKGDLLCKIALRKHEF